MELSEGVRQMLAWVAIAVILAIVMFSADREQPESKPDEDEGPIIIDEDELE